MKSGYHEYEGIVDRLKINLLDQGSNFIIMTLYYIENKTKSIKREICGFSHRMDFYHEFEGVILPLVLYIIVFVSIILFILIIAYTTMTVKNHQKNKNMNRWYPVWAKRLESYLKGRENIHDFHLEKEERKLFRDLVIDYYTGEKNEMCSVDMMPGKPLNDRERRKIRMLYRDLDFLSEDLNSIRRGSVFAKNVALGRLSRLELNDAEDLALDLVSEDSNELVLTSVSYLSTIKSRYLQDNLLSIYEWSDNSMYKEITLEVMKAEIDMVHLDDMADSPMDDIRKASATLAGKNGRGEGISILRILAKDEKWDVRYEVARSLGRIGTRRSTNILKKMAKDDDHLVRSAVADALGGSSDRKSIEELEKLALDKDFEVKMMAYTTLSNMGFQGREAVKRLSKIQPEISKEFI